MMAAEAAGIQVFATGGIGGVHRGAETTFDISADLEELGRTQVAVVCAGAKSILDIPKTLEVLESKGVPVLGLSDRRFPGVLGAAVGRQGRPPGGERQGRRQGDRAAVALGLGGVLVANPIPESAALDKDEIEGRINEAIKGAEKRGASRKDLTPFLLKRIFELTDRQESGRQHRAGREQRARGAGDRRGAGKLTK